MCFYITIKDLVLGGEVKGLLVCIEGIDGAGKNTQSEMLGKHLRTIGIRSKIYSYPDYGSVYGKIIKNFLDKKIELSTEELLFLHILDKQKDKKNVENDLKQGKIVITDRYVISAIAYPIAGGVDYESAKVVAALSKLPKPDIVFYIDVPVSVSMERKRKQKGELDRFEAASAYLNKVSNVYNRLYRERFGCINWIKINGKKNAEIVHKEILSELNKLDLVK
jgi:dTMP kinase